MIELNWAHIGLALAALTGCSSSYSEPVRATSSSVSQTPAARVAQAPKPKVIDEFTIYFETDSATLTPMAKRLVKTYSERIFGQRVWIVIEGHDETYGTSEKSERLSKERAQAVVDEFLRNGWIRSVMIMGYKGDRELARPTRDNVKEPLNRRVVVQFSPRR